jgi:hypothetical protein
MDVNNQYLIRAHCSIVTVITTELDCAHQSASRMMSDVSRENIVKVEKKKKTERFQIMEFH